MKDHIHLSRPDITETEIDAVLTVLRSDCLSMGSHLHAFEEAMARRSNRKYGVGVNSGTSGLHLCIRALGIGEGDEVITTPFSFIATANSILFERATPVFVDIDPYSYNMDPNAITSAITPRTKAILPAEAFGNTTHFDEYERIAKEHDLFLIEDSCEALGGVLGDRLAGSFGECSVFGFYPNKQITTGEGGMIVTDREDIRDLFISMRNQGREGHDHVRLGYNYRMSELTATLGVIQLERIDQFLAQRRQVAQWYKEELCEVPEIRLPRFASPDNASWFVFVVRLDDSFTEDDRNKIYHLLLKRSIGSARYFPPIHLQKHFVELLGHKPGDFPICEALCQRTLALPFHANVTHQQVRYSADVLKNALVECKKNRCSC